MKDKIKNAFDSLQASERMKRTAKAAIRKKTFDYGRNVLQRRRYHSRLAAGLLSLALLIGCGTVWYLPATSISVDVNPSIELKVNALDRVITLEGRNADGIELVKDIDVAGMTYDDAMQRILLNSGLQPYLDNGSNITITVAGGGNAQHAEDMLSKILCRAYNIAKEENVLYCQVDWETVRAAKAAGLSIPRYLAWQNLLKSNPALTADDVLEIPEEYIRILAQVIIIEDPCH